MGFLDNETIYKKYDPSAIAKNIKEFPDQIENAWQELEKLSFPTHYINAKNIVVLGMGGSGISGSLAKAYCQDKLKMPLELVKDYKLPNYVDRNSLVIAISYSGGTEETIAGFNEAGQRGAKLFAASSGGEIESLCHKYNAPHYKINYQSLPRASIGYLFMPVIFILAKLKFIELNNEEIKKAVSYLRDFQEKIDPACPTSQNEAKQLAEKIRSKFPFVVGSGILSAVASRLKAQFNENAKSFAVFEEMPEMCHNFLQGLDFPEKIRDKIIIIFLQSRFDHPRNVLRFQAVQDILKKKGLKYQIIELESKGSELSEIFHYLHYVDYVSLYLAMLEQTDPWPMEMITYLKKFLEENK